MSTPLTGDAAARMDSLFRVDPDAQDYNQAIRARRETWKELGIDLEQMTLPDRMGYVLVELIRDGAKPGPLRQLAQRVLLLVADELEGGLLL